MREISTRPRGSIKVMKALSFSLEPVISNTKLSVVEFDDARAENVGEAQALDAQLAFAGNLDQRHLALDKGSLVGQIIDLVNRHQPRQLRLDLLDDHPGSGGHDGDP